MRRTMLGARNGTHPRTKHGFINCRGGLSKLWTLVVARGRRIRKGTQKGTMILTTCHITGTEGLWGSYNLLGNRWDPERNKQMRKLKHHHVTEALW